MEEILFAIAAENQFFFRIVLTITVVILAYLSTVVVRRSRADIQTRTNAVIDEHYRELVYRSTQLGVILITAIAITDIWQIEVFNILLGAGFLGIILGLAARQTLASMFSGIVILFAQPYRIGDWVELDDKIGRVTKVTIINTYLLTSGSERVVVPNDIINQSVINNRSAEGFYRNEVTVGIDYDADVGRAKDVAAECMHEHEGINRTHRPPRVYISDLASSQITMELHFWAETANPTETRQLRSDVLESVVSELQDKGIDIPFPQRQVSHRD